MHNPLINGLNYFEDTNSKGEKIVGLIEGDKTNNGGMFDQ